tara:strand:+ start:269 stop:517 length:249 start_codon:yes stop_codon:yes gene_type:complete
MSNFPFDTPNYFKISNNVVENQSAKCLGPNNFFKNCLDNEKNVIYGSEKPIKEKCTVITGETEVKCNSLWNNLTRRKTLVEY